MFKKGKIKQIIIIADILRHKGGQDGNADMFYGLLSGTIERITDIPVKLLDKGIQYHIQSEIYSYYGYDIKHNECESSIFCGVPVEYWKDLCFQDPNDKLLTLIKNYFKNSLVICREPSPIFIKAFNILKIPYIELAIHSIRFLDDLILAFRSSDNCIYEKLKSFEMNVEEIFYYVNLLKAEALRKYSYHYNTLENNSAIFFGQTAIDRSLLDYKNKQLVDFMMYKDKFEQLTDKFETVYYKPHPHYTDDNILNFVKKFSNTKIIHNEINTYDLLSLPNIKCCCAISSGTLNEARYFGKDIECFLGQPYIYSDEIKNKNKLSKNIHYISISRDFLTPNFWSEILSPLIKTKKIKTFKVNTTNKLRRIIGSSWGYIDNDSQYLASQLKSSILDRA